MADNNSQKVLCEKSGWLVKQGGNFHTWKKRYFVLKGGELSYHPSQNSPPINSGRVLQVEYWEGREFGLVARLAGGRDLYINAESSEERASWFLALYNGCSNRRRRSLH